jgi:hypothetical protein
MNADAIVKALKCCNVPSGRACSECPYYGVGSECRTKRNKDAAEFIEEMSAELLAVKAAWRKSDFAYIDLNAECEGKLKTIKADTVRKMQNKIISQSEYGTINISTWQLDQIAKEVLEENNV